MALNDVVAEIQDKVRVLAGMKRAPNEPPDDMSAFPFSVCYPESGVLVQEPPAVMTGLHDMVVEIHVAHKDLPTDVRKVIGYGTTVPNTLFNAIRTSAWSTIITFEDITYTFGALGWTGPAGEEIETIGWRFTLRAVKTQDTIS